MVYAESSKAMKIEVKLARDRHAVEQNRHCSIEFHSLNSEIILMHFKGTVCMQTSKANKILGRNNVCKL